MGMLSLFWVYLHQLSTKPEADSLKKMGKENPAHLHVGYHVSI
jgi:hypothetical protein